MFTHPHLSVKRLVAPILANPPCSGLLERRRASSRRCSITNPRRDITLICQSSPRATASFKIEMLLLHRPSHRVPLRRASVTRITLSHHPADPRLRPRSTSLLLTVRTRTRRGPKIAAAPLLLALDSPSARLLTAAPSRQTGMFWLHLPHNLS